MECDPESTSVITKFFPKSKLAHYLTFTLRKICGPETFILNCLKRSSRKYPNLNVTVFVFRLRIGGTSNFVVQLLHLWRVEGLYFSVVLQEAKKIQKILKSTL